MLKIKKNHTSFDKVLVTQYQLALVRHISTLQLKAVWLPFWVTFVNLFDDSPCSADIRQCTSSLMWLSILSKGTYPLP